MRVAIIESGENEAYLTKGKEYAVSDELKKRDLTFFTIVNDIGLLTRCIKECCPHLNDGKWKLIDRL